MAEQVTPKAKPPRSAGTRSAEARPHTADFAAAKPVPKPFLEAGQIVGKHGIQGDVKVQSWCDSPELLCQLETLYWDDRTPVVVERAQIHKTLVLMHLAGVDTPEAAEALRGRVLYLDRTNIALPDNLVFIQDILSFAVFDVRLNRVVGRLRNVLTTNPAHDLYEIEGTTGKRFYVPASKPFLKEIDMETGTIYIESIEGLLDLD